jgi:hypothetical protein
MREAVFQLITKTTQSWMPVSTCPMPGASILGFRGIRVPVGSGNAYGHTTGLGSTADAGVVRDKDATTGGMAWGPPV